jgi:hypothetical protein
MAKAVNPSYLEGVAPGVEPLAVRAVAVAVA